jgi:tRNA-2-methylthio-N6-dimethylallyladenosine synthase
MSDLLEQLHDVKGIERIRFITNFPRDMTDDLLQAVRDLPKVMKYLHVPLQSRLQRCSQAHETRLHGRRIP